MDYSAKKLENFLRVSNEELRSFARLTGNPDIHKLSMEELRTYNSEIPEHIGIKYFRSENGFNLLTDTVMWTVWKGSCWISGVILPP